MNVSSVPAIRIQALVGIGVLIIGLWVAYVLGSKIAAEDFRTLEYAGLVIAASAIAITILRDWRKGFYMFLIWLLFEDLVRKYLGNNIAIYFAKDILVGLVYMSFFAQVRRG